MRSFLLMLVLLPSFLLSFEGKREETLFSSLDPNSLSELFAFYHLYPGTEHGDKALNKAISLVNKHRETPLTGKDTLPFNLAKLDPFLLSFSKQAGSTLHSFNDKQYLMINKLTDHLANRRLKGYHCESLQKLHTLEPSEIDLARGLFLSQFGEEDLSTCRKFEAHLDMMALAIMAKLPKFPTRVQIIDQINQFIFFDMLFRFPPHSLWAEDVDQYTFLPSVLDSRHGVCLGVSILYLSLAQRLGLDLTIFTPPGHIYLGLRTDTEEINIETTARGVDYPQEVYLSLTTKKVEERNIKEVIGLYYMNAAATAWHAGHHNRAIEYYKKALPFMPGDPLIETFLAFNYLFTGKIKEGREILERLEGTLVEGQISPNSLISDYLAGNVNAEGIALVYENVDETRESIIKKQAKLNEVVKKYPKFQEGLFHIGVTWLQLGRKKEALEVLEKLHQINPENITVEYYLTYLNYSRKRYHRAKSHLKNLKTLLARHNHSPRAYRELEKELRRVLPLS